MNKKDKIMDVIKGNDVFDNPGGGTSIVVRITDDYIWYKRKNSTMPLPIHAYFKVISDFKSKKCSSTDLKKYMPDVFSSKYNGHDCNCTFLFRIAEKAELLVNGIQGKGKCGSPFYVVFK